MTVDEAYSQDVRLALLQALAEGGSSNEVVLGEALEQMHVRRPSAVRLRAELDHLADAGLIHLTRIVAVGITERGEDVAAGRATASGVRRATP